MSAPVRVLHVGKYYPPAHGGIERYLADLVGAQQRAGDDVAVLVHEHAGFRPGGDDPPWLDRVPVWLRLLFTPISPAFPSRLARAIRQHRPSVLCLHVPNVSAFWALIGRSARQLPWVVYWHADVEPSRFRPALRLAYPFYRLLERALLERADAIIVTSQAYLEASEPLGPWRRKCHVVPLGADRNRLPSPPAPCEAEWRTPGLRVLFVGRLTYYKGLDTLIAAAGATTAVEVLIAGDGEERRRLERAIAATGASQRIRLLGEVDDQRLCGLLASCHLVALPSCERTEAFGVILLEAMRYAKPLLVSRLPGSGVTHVARDGVNAMLVPPEEVEAWKRALAAAAADPQGLQALGARGRERFEREYEIGIVARRVRSVLAMADVAAHTDNDDPDNLPVDIVRDFNRARAGQYLIVIPALDEAATIGEVVQRARSLSGADVVVVDDGSRDETRAEALAAGAIVLRAPLWQGAWGAIQTGIRFALRHGYAGVVTMDADGQHEPAHLPRLVSGAATADVVIAACPSRGSFWRHVAWGYFRLLTGFDIGDLTSGFRYYNVAACRLLAGEEATLLDYQDLGVLLLIRRSGLRVAEIPVPMNPRAFGISRVFSSWWTVCRYMADTTLLCLARWGQAGPRQS